MRLRAIAFSSILLLGLAACDDQQTVEVPSESAESETALAPDNSQAPATDPETVGSIDTPITPYLGQTYSSGPVSLQLNRDNSFVMNQVEGNRSVQGQYAYEDGVLTFSQPAGDMGDTNFPLRCQMEPAGADGFQLQDQADAPAEQSCGPLKDLTFRPAA